MQSLTLQPRDARPSPRVPAPGPQVRAQAVHLRPAADESGLSALIATNVARGGNKEGQLKLSNLLADSWSTAWSSNLCVEFELPQSVALSGIEVWNFNAALATTNGARKLDVAISSDGQTWQTVLRGAELAEAPGTWDYDAPALLKLDGTAAKWVRFENLSPLSNSGRVGLGRVVFHQTAEMSAAPAAK